MRLYQDAVRVEYRQGTVLLLNLFCLPSDPNVRKAWMNFIFNEVPDCISKNQGRAESSSGAGAQM